MLWLVPTLVGTAAEASLVGAQSVPTKVGTYSGRACQPRLTPTKAGRLRPPDPAANPASGPGAVSPWHWRRGHHLGFRRQQVPNGAPASASAGVIAACTALLRLTAQQLQASGIRSRQVGHVVRGHLRPGGPRASRRAIPITSFMAVSGRAAQPFGPVNGRRAATLSPHQPDRPEW